jgi:hypothetical protein
MMYAIRYNQILSLPESELSRTIFIVPYLSEQHLLQLYALSPNLTAQDICFHLSLAESDICLGDRSM